MYLNYWKLKVETTSQDRAVLLHQLNDHLVDTFKQGKHTIVIVDEAMQEIYQYSCGTPRKINNICDLSLLLGFGQRVNQIQPNHIVSIINSES